MSRSATDPGVSAGYAVRDGTREAQRQLALLKAGALQNAILTSANFSIIATDEKGTGIGLVMTSI